MQGRKATGLTARLPGCLGNKDEKFMKKFSKVSLLIVLAVFFMAGNAMAVTVVGNELQTYFDGKPWNLNAQNDQMTMPEGWVLTTASTASNMTFYKEQTAGNMSFGIYSTANFEEAVVFDASDTPETRASVEFYNGNSIVVERFDNNVPVIPAETELFAFTGETFGFWISNGTNKYYSDADLNDVNKDGVFGDEIDIALLVYEADNGSYVFAGDINGNKDFATIVSQAESIKPVPEPATLVLMGLGLFGLAGFGRQKYKK